MKNKQKVPTCGNCAHLQKRDNRKTVIHLRYAVNLWFCPERWWSWKKPQNIALEQTIEAITNEEKVYGKNPFPYPEYIIDITSRMYGFKYGNKETHYGLCRGVEIDRWLREHQDVTNYIILDDDSDMLLSQKKHFIKTHALNGICKKDVEKAIKILNS